VEQNQVARHEATIHGHEGDPWRYRLLSEWVAGGALGVARTAGFHEPAVVGFLGFRVLENIAIFALAWMLLRRLGASRQVAALGLCLIAFAMTQALYHAGLAFDSYAEVAVYLAGALLVLTRRHGWVVPLAVLGALNRETSGLVPVMVLAAAVPLGLRTREGRRVALIGAAALAAYALTVGAVRLAVGPADLILPEGKHPGWEILELNVTRAVTWDNVFRTVTLVPLVALVRLRHWPRELKVMALAVVPVWLAAHLLGAVLAETRLLLVPYALVAVPGALAGLGGGPREGLESPVAGTPVEDAARSAAASA
jgi:hypothetical protein